MTAFDGGRDMDLDEPRVAILWLRDAAGLALALINAVLWTMLLYVVIAP